jgi:ABC-2 type transport system permease protein
VTAVTARPVVHARPAGFLRDLRSVAYRAIRAVPREPEFIIPAIVIPVFFYFVNIGALERIAEGTADVSDFRAFQLPVAIIFAVTGISRVGARDRHPGRLLRPPADAPIRRVALLLGLMVADLLTVVALTLPVLALGFAMGVGFDSGLGGLLVFVAMETL